jgi:hypothetical protein
MVRLLRRNVGFPKGGEPSFEGLLLGMRRFPEIRRYDYIFSELLKGKPQVDCSFWSF